MLVYIILSFTLGMAVIALVLLWRSARAGSGIYPDRAVVAAMLAVFVYHYGAWVFLSVYARYVFAGVMSVEAIVLLMRGGRRFLKPREAWRAATNVVLAIVLATLTVLYYTGTAPGPYGVAALSFPFSKGRYLVFQGGRGLPTNVFHYSLRGAVYAIDLVKLNNAGNRAGHIFSKDLDDYAIFGDTLYSPCDGVVLRAKDENPDNIPPARKRGPSNTNHVLLGTPSFYVFMGHLRQHCVFVHEGDHVHQGQALACIGNSGFSLEPHLHIQAHARTDVRLPWYKEKPMLITFDGREYRLFETINAGNGH